MRSRTIFWSGLAVFALLYFGYGLKRLSLGIDFTDEGAYLAWPLRMLFGERPFASELVTLTRPVEVFLFLPFKLYPAMTLYEFRLLGWTGHIAAFCALAACLFRLSGAAGQSLLIASVPFFVCHIFGLAPPCYNTLSSDFLLMALSLRVLSATAEGSWKTPLAVGGGLALFVATLAHPALGAVAAVLLVYELWRHRLGQNLLRGTLTPPNLGMLAFLACWVALLGYAVASGAAAQWLERIALTRSFSGNSLHAQPGRFFILLAGYPFLYSRLAAGFSGGLAIAAGSLILLARAGKTEAAARAAAALAVLLIVSLICTFSYEPDYLPMGFARAGLVLLGTLAFVRLPAAPTPESRCGFLLALSGLAAVIYATFTYYFSVNRSWLSGILGLPFAFGVGLTLLLNLRPKRAGLFRILVPASLALAVACVAREHYLHIYRDAEPPELTATFQSPKLRSIRSTDERVRAIDELSAFMRPRIARGDPLVVFDEGPMLYFILDARPVYGLTWAVRYNQDPAVLRSLDAELRAQPLPRYAIRVLVDLANVVWRDAPRLNYDNYPLNATVTTRYELERTIFPFEVWRLKNTSP